ncbi:hypothetical protein DACRYDRAFT_21221 [Dacryopinax primogenitus]|uniref:Phosphatidylglycerol/phosphatidylinositol transfer protein n=1 Tax=Dacryopinax primogenitus (strain DJM 731) TaxID=1858805 RepID=M5GCA7_DACPD|nr:uncharacterized protein DACRYDRAFT_21221 [Dacryopinax primogenitus]EJU03762.1 hypothetical protein DACRYDRAFT_21221 [Dacryopinax primogenitus]
MFVRTLITLSALAATTFGSILPQLPLFNDGDVTAQAGWTWSDCGDPSFAIEVQSIEVTPDPPVPGKNMTVDVVGTARSSIEDGSFAEVTVKLGMIQLLKKQFDVCMEAQKANVTVQCPVEAGHYAISKTVTLPREIPRTKFIVNVRGSTQDDVDMICLDLSVNFGSKP